MGNNTSKELDSDTLDMSQSSSNFQRGGDKLEYTIQQLVRNSQENTDNSDHFFTDVDFDSAVAMAQMGGAVTDTETPVRRYHNNPNYKKNRKQNLSSVNEYDLNLLMKQFGGEDKKPKETKKPEQIKTGGSIGHNQLSKNVVTSDSETYSQIVKNFKQQMNGGYHPVSKTVLSEKSETNSEIVAAFKKQMNASNKINQLSLLPAKVLTGGKHSDLAQETSDYGNFSIVESEILSQTSDVVYKKGGSKKGGSKKLLMNGGSKSIILSGTSDAPIDYDILKNKRSSSMNGGGECGCTKSGDTVLPATKLSEIKTGGGKIFSPKKIDSIVSSSSNNPVDYNVLVGGASPDFDSDSDSPSINKDAEKSNSDSDSELNLENLDSDSNSQSDSKSDSKSVSQPDSQSDSKSDSESDSRSNSQPDSEKDGDDTNTSSDSSPIQTQNGGLSSSAGLTSASEIVINSKFLYSDNTFYGSENVSDKYNSFSSMIE